ncbi:MAG: hypothetical protein IJS65_05150, partial [Clostridia bacterium]|nr:hypothetical protein [Clostridia bacterium]
MKRTLALLLASVLTVWLFSACGAKTPAPRSGSENTARTDGGDTAADAPDAKTDDEERDKDATETVSATGDVVIVSQEPLPQTTTGVQPSPDGQAEVAQESPRTETPAQTKPGNSQASSSDTSKGLVPASGKVTLPYGLKKTSDHNINIPILRPETAAGEIKEEYNLFFFGDGFLAAHNTGDVMVKLAEADGIRLNFPDHPLNFDNIGTDLTYNFYDPFNWDGDGADSKITSISSAKAKSVVEDPANNKVDFFLYSISRDRGLCIESSRGRIITATEYFTKALSNAQPDVKTVLLAPSGYMEGNNGALINKIGLKQKTLKEHNKATHEFTDVLLSKTSGNKQAVYICDAFDYFIDNYSSSGIDLYDFNRIYPSMAGAYYTACVTYSSMFGRATSGIPFFGLIEDESVVKTLQKAADEFVSSSGVNLKPHSKTYSYLPMTLEQADPRNQPQRPDRAFENYPQGYDELLASAMAYYQRMGLVQYDNMPFDQIRFTFSRREVDKNLSPEEATPQNVLFSDCSAFIHALFTDAFNFDFNGADRCVSIFDNEELLTDGWRVWYYDGSVDTRSPEELSKDFLSVLQPGDLVDYKLPDNSGGHIVLYLGNGRISHLTGVHASGGGENYSFSNGTDRYEMINGVLYGNLEYVSQPGEAGCLFGKKDYKIGIFRPFSLGLKPTAQAKNRVNNLRNVIAYKHTSAPEGVSVSPGGDVTFTFVIKNIDYTAKTVTITDKLPQGVSFKSGKDFKAQGADLTATVTVPAGATVNVPYTVTVDKNVPLGKRILCHDAYLNGVRHNEVVIYVNNTLSDSQQKALVSAADSAGKASGADFDFIVKAYKDALNVDFPYASLSDI